MLAILSIYFRWVNVLLPTLLIGQYSKSKQTSFLLWLLKKACWLWDFSRGNIGQRMPLITYANMWIVRHERNFNKLYVLAIWNARICYAFFSYVVYQILSSSGLTLYFSWRPHCMKSKIINNKCEGSLLATGSCENQTY